jgi:phosphoglycolate phosphatase-like HAD superfamily hydrolase
MTTNPLILFDIDGTLLRGGGIGRRTMAAAFKRVLGLGPALDTSLASVPFHGNTDFAIIRDGLESMGLEATDQRVDAILDCYLDLIGKEVATNNPFFALDGAVDHVERLTSAGVPMGLGTGNVEPAAWLKVEAVGLRHHFGFGGFGSDHIERSELLRIGWRRGAALHGRPPEAFRVLVIGDTIRDIDAAQRIGASVIAVATGGDPLDVLAAKRPDHLVPTLSDPSVAHWVDRWLIGEVAVRN